MQHTQALAANNAQQHISASTIVNALANASTTFAQVTYVTTVKAAAAHKHVTLKKVVTANVQLFANIKAATNVFANAVQKNANVQQFVTSSNYFTHTNCYSIVQHNKTSKLYLYAIFNNVAQTTYYANNVAVTKQQFASYLTASASAKLLSSSNVTHNVRNNVTHSVVVRTIALSNIVALNVNKAQLSAAAA